MLAALHLQVRNLADTQSITALATTQHLPQVKTHPSPSLYDELRPIFVMLGASGFATGSEAVPAEAAGGRRRSSASGVDKKAKPTDSTDDDLVFCEN